MKHPGLKMNGSQLGKDPLSSTEVPFVLPVGWGMGQGETKHVGAGEMGNESVGFLVISPLKEPLWRTEADQ